MFRWIAPLLALAAAAAARADTPPTVGPVSAGGPAAEAFHVVIMGDSLADGLWLAMSRWYARDKGIRIVKASLASTGFNHTNYPAELDALAARQPIGLLIVQTGANDGQRVIDPVDRSWHAFATPGWQISYRLQLARFLAAVRRHNVPVVWVGLPVMREPVYARNIRLIETAQREQAAAFGVPHVDAFVLTATPDGRYSDFGPSLYGPRPLRFEDGVHSTLFGYDKVARAAFDAVRLHYPEAARRLGAAIER